MHLNLLRNVVILLIVFFGANTVRVIAGTISVIGREAKASPTCSEDLPGFEMTVDTFLVVSSNTDVTSYGICPITISFSGDISSTAMAKLKTVLEIAVESANTPLVILDLQSEGGDVWEALSLAKFIRSRDYRYVFAKVSEGAYCNSSCVFILAGAFKRRIYGTVGIHRPYFTDTRAREMGYFDLKQAYDALQSDLNQFFHDVNISTRLVDDMWLVPSHEIRVLSSAELDNYGLLRDDAVLMEMDNTALRDFCGRDAPNYRDDWFANIITPCLDVRSVYDVECINRRGSKHPFCECSAHLNPKAGFVCE